ncbi:PEP-CTERM exosortase interaction domain protein [Ostertagia ostertagi]
MTAGTTITFTDLGLNAAGAFKAGANNENTWTWTATSDVAAGTQIVVYGGSYNVAAGTTSGGTSGQGAKNVTTGSLSFAPTLAGGTYNLDFSSSGEVIYAMQGTSFVAALNNFTAPPSSGSDNPLQSGLSFIQNINYTAANGGTGDGVIQRTEWYSGPTAGLTAAEYKLAIANMANWEKDPGSTAAYRSLVLLEGAVQSQLMAGGAAGIGAGNFNIVAAPVPEPGTYALLLAGMAVVGGVARRRSARQSPDEGRTPPEPRAVFSGSATGCVPRCRRARCPAPPGPAAPAAACAPV